MKNVLKFDDELIKDMSDQMGTEEDEAPDEVEEPQEAPAAPAPTPVKIVKDDE